MCESTKHRENVPCDGINRRTFLKNGLGSAVAVASIASGTRLARAATDPYADPAEPALPPSDMVLDVGRAALVVSQKAVEQLDNVFVV